MDQKERDEMKQLSSDVVEIKTIVQGMKESLVRIEDDQKKNYVTRHEYSNTKGDVEDIKKTLTWINRIIIGVVITALLGLVIVS